MFASGTQSTIVNPLGHFAKAVYAHLPVAAAWVAATLCISSSLQADESGNQAIVIEAAQATLVTDLPLAAPVAGRVRSLSVVEGQQVSKGELLVQLDDRRAKAELEAAQAASQAAALQSTSDVDQRYAERTREVRMRELEQSLDANRRFQNSVTATEIDRLQLVIDQAGLSIEQAHKESEIAEANANEKQSLVRMAELRVAEHRLESPLSGSVAEVTVSPGEWVDAGQPLLRLISLDPIRVSGFVDGRQHGAELNGRAVEFEWTESINGQENITVLRGEVTFVSLELHPVNSQVRMWASLRNPDRKARPGVRGTLRIFPADRTLDLPAE
ncbi:multidrug efflux pump [Rhodopirellula islandica]|uniref:Multidrug efflux pump n=1 Tax=Rhodopirellula islandica TaxID=595434 RepID=A0A0J1B3V9_RHOIS|nr:HlyD family efflux transporter periplasmic adaptor subunit [Rhodopirellula islandica]KLU01442.1 multidrug efflux pump [Rhodopirellula islandica]